MAFTGYHDTYGRPIMSYHLIKDIIAEEVGVGKVCYISEKGWCVDFSGLIIEMNSTYSEEKNWPITEFFRIIDDEDERE